MTDKEMLDGFEAGTLPLKQWNHASHLRVAGCYLLAHRAREALKCMREGVRRYNEAVGVGNTEDSGYHETLTRFWIAIAAAFLDGLPAPMTPAGKIQALVDEFGSRRDLVREYYSFDLVKSREARACWVDSDLKPLPRNNSDSAGV